MIILDESIDEQQQKQLLRRRIRAFRIGNDIGRAGMQDEEIIPFLRTLRRPTFFAWDSDFYHKRLCSNHFCLVYLNVRVSEITQYIRRLLRHPEFKTWAQRKGRVVRLAPSGISVWQIRVPRLKRYGWND